jgi:hypothetical protein
MKFIATLVLALILMEAQSQTSYYVTTNANLYVPEGNSTRGFYPILWYSNDTDPHVLIGGLGVGFTFQKASPKTILKAESNISRHAYWETMHFTDINGVALGSTSFGTADLTIHLLPTISYRVSEKFSIGTGLGGVITVMSRSRIPFGSKEQDRAVMNNYYKFLIPVIPLDFSYTRARKQYTLRFENTIGSRYKKPLSDYKREGFLLITFQMGFKLNQN